MTNKIEDVVTFDGGTAGWITTAKLSIRPKNMWQFLPKLGPAMLPQILLIVSLLSIASVAFAKPEVIATAHSPGKVLSVSLSIDEGRLSYAVARFGQPVIAPSRLGFLLQGAQSLDRNIALVSQEISSFDATWEQPWGESRLVRNHYQ